MTEPAVPGDLGRHAFLNGMSESHLRVLAAGARAARYAAGDYLGREGEPAEDFFLIQAGFVSLGIHTPDRGVVPLQSIGPGHALGWSWLVPPHRWRFDCRASETVEVLAFNGQWLRDQCEQDHELGYQLLKHLIGVIASRLAATRLQLLDLHR